MTTKKKPNKVFAVDGMIVLARHAKGAISVANRHGCNAGRSAAVTELPKTLADRAVNARVKK